ncbi:MAG TPA: cysteine desulfurase family protein [Gemmatimonadales bacterium]|nr:cysteine desulfurase family protein [Gemmatimonadales bacterium]
MPPRPVYFDHAATTPVRPEVRDAMLPYLGGDLFGNPSSAHRFGRAARAGLEQARREVADATGVTPDCVIFTSGGTEADNLAIVGAALAARAAGRRMLVAVSATEHKAILASAHEVVRLGGEERILPVLPSGLLDLDALDALLAEQPAIVSVMHVNNETGVIQPIEEIARRCHAAGVPFHSDLVQSFGKLPVSLDHLPHLTFATISGHKLGAPKGCGALLARDCSLIAPLILGGGQQRGIRPGTENLIGIVGLGCAAKLAVQEREHEAKRMEQLATKLETALRSVVPDIRITAEDSPRAPHVLSVSIPGTEGAALLLNLDMAGVAASGGSACSTGSPEPSHVLAAMSIPTEQALGTVRFSMGHGSTEEDIARLVEVLPKAVAKVRKLVDTLKV